MLYIYIYLEGNTVKIIHRVFISRTNVEQWFVRSRVHVYIIILNYNVICEQTIYIYRIHRFLVRPSIVVPIDPSLRHSCLSSEVERPAETCPKTVSDNRAISTFCGDGGGRRLLPRRTTKIASFMHRHINEWTDSREREVRGLSSLK